MDLFNFLDSVSEKGAANYFVQIQHRRNAIEYTIAGCDLVRSQNVEQFKYDQVFAELEGLMKGWVIETLTQGAYIREYHIWEKDTKQYFTNQLIRNKNREKFPTSGSHVCRVKKVLGMFGATLSSEILAKIDAMREKVNKAKHEPGVLVEHFISQAEYDTAIQAIEAFWDDISEQEKFSA